MTPKGDVERYIGAQKRTVSLPDYSDSRPVGPFGAGLFLRSGSLESPLIGEVGQWGMIRPGRQTRIPEKRYQTNNARIESISEKPTYRQAWRNGQRCLVPATWYAEPNWETGKNIWWHLKRADGAPWFLAGLWSDWIDHATGEVVPNFTMITCNCDEHPLLNRLHKPAPKLPPEKQDKRSLIHIDANNWERWLHGSTEEALELIQPQPANVFDHADAERTDEALSARRGQFPSLF